MNIVVPAALYRYIFLSTRSEWTIRIQRIGEHHHRHSHHHIHHLYTLVYHLAPIDKSFNRDSKSSYLRAKVHNYFISPNTSRKFIPQSTRQGANQITPASEGANAPERPAGKECGIRNRPLWSHKPMSVRPQGSRVWGVSFPAGLRLYESRPGAS